MERPGADLIAHYLDPDRLPAEDRWSRNHAHTQRLKPRDEFRPMSSPQALGLAPPPQPAG